MISSGAVGENADTRPQFLFSTNLGDAGDPRLSGLVGNAATHDAATYKLVVKPKYKRLNVQYVFASEEYPEYVGDGYDDVMSIWVEGVPCANVPNTIEVAVADVRDGLLDSEVGPLYRGITSFE